MNEMDRAPVSSRRPCASQDPQRRPLCREEEGATPTALAVSSTTLGGRGGAHMCSCTVSSPNREGTCSSNILSYTLTHSTSPVVPWGCGRQPNHLQAPPRLAPLTESPIVARGFGPPPIAPAPLALAESSEHALCAPQLTFTAGAPGGTCLCSARSALPLLPFSSVLTASQRATPVPVWRRSKPLTRLPATTLGPTLSGNSGSPDDVVVALSDASMPKGETGEWMCAEASLQPSAAEPTPNAGSAVRHVDYQAAATQTGCVGSSLAAKVATESSQMALPDALAHLVEPPQGASAPSKTATDQLVNAPVGDIELRKRREEDSSDARASLSSALSSLGHPSNHNVHSSVDGVLWAHEAPEQPAYAHQHQLPAIFSQLVQDLLAAEPRADVEGDDDLLERWIQSWFENRCMTQPLQQSRSNSMKHLRTLQEAAVGAIANGAYVQGARSSNYVEPREKPAVDKNVGDATHAGPAARPAAGPSTTISASAAVTRTTTKSASAQLFPSSTAASPPHQYVPLTVEYSCSTLQSRMTSGASQRATSPPKPPQAQPLPVSPGTLHTAGASSTPGPPPHSAADGGGGVLAAVVGLSSPPQQPQQQPQPAKPLSGGPHLPAPASTRSMSSKQTVVAAAALAGGGEGDKGASGARPKLATTACAVFAHSSSSSAPKEAAHPHE
ncbi:hypothetical protein LMJF_21_1490 [Leishmania major strain Friedlin]|uniref:Uncharacterized protein n=1 Tax=Leishmania major TaxID=5664 RepID=Q4QC46_LEIMA|nr:hypothetical protein LMJF_21_1490 [Leishmania major strain Friedlin]CAG9573573.1 hypothetical_protein_-_conserved [Leishmania major strain Friedlin]CAJ04862.1 hypothetical protein LMJF_21_1490 [Leishmania major strain Friedlin]|eukprot:XP_001683102.1 hypothetical protein LMJF_21_1490 [Leishmania major strain Friedlin]